CESLARGLEPLTGSKTDNIRLKFDYSTVDVLQRAERRRLDNVRSDWVAGAISLDDYLTELGQKPLQTPESRARITPAGLVIPANDEDREHFKQNVTLLTALAAQQRAAQDNPFGAGVTGGTG